MRSLNLIIYFFLIITVLQINDGFGAGRWNTGVILMEHCNATLRLQDIDNPTHDEHVKSVACLSYLEGIKQMLYEESSLMQKRNICFPDLGISNGQAARIVVNFIDEFPDKLNNHKLDITLDSFSYAFPCK